LNGGEQIQPLRGSSEARIDPGAPAFSKDREGLMLIWRSKLEAKPLARYWKQKKKALCQT
jgi:hypothetical protein